MAKITDIQIVDVQWRDDSASIWKNVSAYSKTESPTPLTTEVPIGAGGGAVVLYTDPTGFDPATTAGYPANINWEDFLIDGKTDKNYTIFGALSGQIATTVKSPLIRYKIKTTTDAPSSVTNAKYHYMMLSADFDSSNSFTGAGGTTTVTGTQASCQICFYFPGFEATDTSGDAVAAINTLLQDVTRWTISSRGTSSGYIKDFTPTSVTLRPAENDANYGLAKIPVKMTATLEFPTSDTYTVKVKFASNDGDAAFMVTGSQTITATITAYTGSTQAVLVSNDSDAAFTISFSQASA